MKLVIVAIVVVAAAGISWFAFQGRTQAASGTTAAPAINANPTATPASTDMIPERIRGSWYRPARQPLNGEPIRLDLSNSQVILYFPNRPEVGIARPVVFVRQNEATTWTIDVTVIDPDFGKYTGRYLVRLEENSPIGDERLGNKSTLKSMVTISWWVGDLNAAPTTQAQDIEAYSKANSALQTLGVNRVGFRPIVSSGSFLTKADADKWSKYLVDLLGW